MIYVILRSGRMLPADTPGLKAEDIRCHAGEGPAWPAWVSGPPPGWVPTPAKAGKAKGQAALIDTATTNMTGAR